MEEYRSAKNFIRVVNSQNEAIISANAIKVNKIFGRKNFG